MKKILGWITKGSTITKIVKNIYSGCVIIHHTLSGFRDSVMSTGILLSGSSLDNAIKIISVVIEYLDVAIEKLGNILSWLGVNVESYRGSIIYNIAEGNAETSDDVSNKTNNRNVELTALIHLKDKLKEIDK